MRLTKNAEVTSAFQAVCIYRAQQEIVLHGEMGTCNSSKHGDIAFIIKFF